MIYAYPFRAELKIYNEKGEVEWEKYAYTNTCWFAVQQEEIVDEIKTIAVQNLVAHLAAKVGLRVVKAEFPKTIT